LLLQVLAIGVESVSRFQQFDDICPRFVHAGAIPTQNIGGEPAVSIGDSEEEEEEAVVVVVVVVGVVVGVEEEEDEEDEEEAVVVVVVVVGVGEVLLQTARWDFPPQTARWHFQCARWQPGLQYHTACTWDM
jgi:hypothetical protein